MTWENCCYWTGDYKDWDDIDPHNFDWWCSECSMAIKDCDVEDERCPCCGEELSDMENEIDVYEEYHNSPGNGLTEDEEGNLGYD